MPSPFPGMDPWLEDPEVFPDLHDSFIAYSREALQAALPEPYYAVIGRRTWLEVSHRSIEPDVKVLHPRGPRSFPAPAPELPGHDSSGVATLTSRETRMVVVTVPQDELREIFVDIYEGRDENARLVVSIEMLSPSNKTPGEHGRRQYRRKQQEMLHSKVHLIEIDLLRAGRHTTAVPYKQLIAAAQPFDYHVCVRRFDDIEDFFIYPIRLSDPLPEITVPLLPDDNSVLLDLQAVFTRCYDTGPYSREINYLRREPIPPLTAEQSHWARQFLTAPAAATA